MTDAEQIIKNREYSKRHYEKMMDDPDSREKMMEVNRVRAKAYYHKNKNDPVFIEKSRIIDIRYQEKNKEAIKARQTIYRTNNKERIRARQRDTYAKNKADGTLDINKKRKALHDLRVNNLESVKIPAVKNIRKVKEKTALKKISVVIPKKFSSRLPRKDGLNILRKDVKIISCKKPKLINRFAVHRAEIIMRLKSRKAFNEGMDTEKKVCDNLE